LLVVIFLETSNSGLSRSIPKNGGKSKVDSCKVGILSLDKTERAESGRRT